MRFTTLKRSAEFKRVRGGVRWAGPLFIVEGKARIFAAGAGVTTPDVGSEPRFGFTITKKVGSAVVRNRIRRRLKEALRGLEPQCASPHHDYVVVASRAAHDYPFAELQEALRAAMQRLQRQVKHAPAASGSARHRDGGRQSRVDGLRAGPVRDGKRPPGPTDGTALLDDQDT